MKCLGFNFHKGKIRYTALGLNAGKINFLSHGKIDIDVQLELSILMDRYRSNIIELINSEKPDIISCRQIFESKNNDSAIFQIMPVAILALECQRNNPAIPIHTYSPPALRGHKQFSLNKGEKPIDQVDKIFGNHAPNWDDQARWALVAAWRALSE